MLRIMGSERQFCDGVTRREMLQVGGAGLMGLGLSDLLANGSVAPPSVVGSTTDLAVGLDEDDGGIELRRIEIREASREILRSAVLDAGSGRFSPTFDCGATKSAVAIIDERRLGEDGVSGHVNWLDPLRTMRSTDLYPSRLRPAARRSRSFRVRCLRRGSLRPRFYPSPVCGLPGLQLRRRLADSAWVL